MHCEWANRGYMLVLQNTWATLKDEATLSRIGLAMTADEIQALLADRANAEYNLSLQDDLAEVLGCLLQKINARRMASMMLYSETWPAALAPLGQEEWSLAEPTMHKLRTHACALSAAHSSGRSDLEQSASKSVLRSTYMKHVLSRLAANYWSPTPPFVQQSVREVFSSLLSTRINEEAHHHLRELELGRKASKATSALKIWAEPLERQVLRQYGRGDLAAAETGRIFENRELMKVFYHEAASTAMHAEDAENAVGVDDHRDWHRWNREVETLVDDKFKGVGGSHASDIEAAGVEHSIVELWSRSALDE
eukprot:6473042-Amphidinium_carterae.1